MIPQHSESQSDALPIELPPPFWRRAVRTMHMGNIPTSRLAGGPRTFRVYSPNISSARARLKDAQGLEPMTPVRRQPHYILGEADRKSTGVGGMWQKTLLGVGGIFYILYIESQHPTASAPERGGGYALDRLCSSFWLRAQGSNLKPFGSEPNALPIAPALNIGWDGWIRTNEYRGQSPGAQPLAYIPI